MKNKHFEHIIHLVISEFIDNKINKDLTSYHPLDNLFYNINYEALSQEGRIDYHLRTIQDSLEHFQKFSQQYIKVCIDFKYIFEHPFIKDILTELELKEMLFDKDLNLEDIVRDELIGKIKGTEYY